VSAVAAAASEFGRAAKSTSMRLFGALWRSCWTLGPTPISTRCATPAAHVMAEAVLGLFPDAQLGIGPSIDDGFYYDFLLPRPLTPDDLASVERECGASIAADHPFIRKEVPFNEGRAFFVASAAAVQGRDPRRPGRPRRRERLTAAAHVHLRARRIHRPVQGSPRCQHRQDRAVQAHDRGWGLLAGLREAADAAAHLRNGLATQEALDAYLLRREEAKAPRPRRLGVQLDLFSFHDVSPGSAFWHPKGQRLWRILETAIREVQDRRGYQEMSEPPMLVHKKLWQQSGHWANYQDSMFVLESEGQIFSLKPMNCPESTFRLQEQAAFITGTCRCVSPSSGGCIGTSAPGRFRA